MDNLSFEVLRQPETFSFFPQNETPSSCRRTPETYCIYFPKMIGCAANNPQHQRFFGRRFRTPGIAAASRSGLTVIRGRAIVASPTPR